MTVEQQLKDKILREYKSIRAFAEYIGMPYSTIDSIFKRGINNSSVSNVLKICKALSVDADALGNGELTSAEPRNEDYSPAVLALMEKIQHFSPQQLEAFETIVDSMLQKKE